MGLWLALQGIWSLAVSFGASVPDSTLHFRASWRLHESWLLAVPPEFRTPLWTSSSPSPLPPPSREKLNLVYLLWECFISAATHRLCADEEGGPQKTLERYVQEGVYCLESLSLPTHVTRRLKSSTNLLQLCLPTSHPNTVDQRLERVVEFRV